MRCDGEFQGNPVNKKDLPNSAKPIKRTENNSLDMIVFPQINTNKPAIAQKIAKNAGKPNRLKGNNKICHEISTNREAEIQ